MERFNISIRCKIPRDRILSLSICTLFEAIQGSEGLTYPRNLGGYPRHISCGASLFPFRACQVNSGEDSFSSWGKCACGAPTAGNEDYPSFKGRLTKFCIRGRVYHMTTCTLPLPTSISKIFKRCLEQVIQVLLCKKGSSVRWKIF